MHHCFKRSATFCQNSQWKGDCPLFSSNIPIDVQILNNQECFEENDEKLKIFRALWNMLLRSCRNCSRCCFAMIEKKCPSKVNDGDTLLHEAENETRQLAGHKGASWRTGSRRPRGRSPSAATASTAGCCLRRLKKAGRPARRRRAVSGKRFPKNF